MSLGLDHKNININLTLKTKELPNTRKYLGSYFHLSCMFSKIGGKRIGDGMKEATWQYYLYNPQAIIAHIRIRLNRIWKQN